MALAVRGGEAVEAADAAAVHAARHGHVGAAQAVARELYPGRGVTAVRDADSIIVRVTDVLRVAHPDSARQVDIVASSVMPLAPFRSDRG